MALARACVLLGGPASRTEQPGPCRAQTKGQSRHAGEVCQASQFESKGPRQGDTHTGECGVADPQAEHFTEILEHKRIWSVAVSTCLKAAGRGLPLLDGDLGRQGPGRLTFIDGVLAGDVSKDKNVGLAKQSQASIHGQALVMG